MFSILRMELYRMVRSKSVYIGFGILSAISILAFWLTFLLTTPKGQEAAVKMGMLALSEMEEGSLMLKHTDLLEIFREIGMDGGFFGCMTGILTSLFLCGDFQNGFIKNIMTQYRERSKYVAGKLAAMGILNFVFLAAGFLFDFLLNVLFGNMFQATAWNRILFYMAWAWLVSTAFSALIILICVLTRSLAAGVLASVLLGGGMVVSLLASLMSLFHANGWLSYTLYFNMSNGPSACSGPGDLRIFAVGLVFLCVYFGAAVYTIRRQDI